MSKHVVPVPPSMEVCPLMHRSLTRRGSDARRRGCGAALRGIVVVLAPLLALLAATPARAAAREVVVYAALDRQFSEPILEAYEKNTGVRVRAIYDAEATKTIGLVNRIRAERERPRCDVFWNNEIVNTIRLQDEGLLQPVSPPQARNYAAQFRDPEGHWFGFAARARVLLVNTTLVPADARPRSIRDLADRRWRGRVGIAKPLFGTTASHAACLFATLGERDAGALFDAWKANEIVIVSGNKGAAEAVGAGRLAFALTDTDDAVAEVDAGRPVEIVFPDRPGAASSAPAGERAAATSGSPADDAPRPLGTLVLPNTVMLIRGAPNADEGAALINYLLSPEVENRLAEGGGAQIPLNRLSTSTPRVGRLGDADITPVDLRAAARAFPGAANYIESRFLAP